MVRLILSALFTDNGMNGITAYHVYLPSIKLYCRLSSLSLTCIGGWV